MARNADLPYHLYVNVDNKLLGPNMPPGTTCGLWHGVYCRPDQTLMCHVMLESGAHWSGLPLQGLSTTVDFSKSHSELMPWAAMGEHLEVAAFKYLEGLYCMTRLPFVAPGRHTGLVIDWSDGYSRYPQEHKPLSLIALESGQFALLPNNFLVFKDEHFIHDAAKENLRFYRRGETVYWG